MADWTPPSTETEAETERALYEMLRAYIRQRAGTEAELLENGRVHASLERKKWRHLRDAAKSFVAGLDSIVEGKEQT